MCCKNFRKKVLPFTLAFILGLFAVNLLQANVFKNKYSVKGKRVKTKPTAEITYPKQGGGSSGKSISSCGWSYTYKGKDGKIHSYSSKEARSESEKFSSKESTANSQKSKKSSENNSSGIQLISKPQPRYTDEAKSNYFQGSITLRVTFNANGSIGSIVAVNRLPYGLTEEAIEAAKKIKFKPAKRYGKSVSQSRRIQYSFTIY
jgi:TonB family protein